MFSSLTWWHFQLQNKFSISHEMRDQMNNGSEKASKIIMNSHKLRFNGVGSKAGKAGDYRMYIKHHGVLKGTILWRNLGTWNKKINFRGYFPMGTVYSLVLSPFCQPKALRQTVPGSKRAIPN